MDNIYASDVRTDFLVHTVFAKARTVLGDLQALTHPGLGKQTPEGRVAAEQANVGGIIISVPRIGGLHHRYDLAA